MSTRQLPPSGNPVRKILLLDDHPLTRCGMKQLLNGEPDMSVCGEAENAPQALTMVDLLHPDLVLADITLPSKSGLEFIKDMQALHPHVPVLVLSMHDEKIFAQRALRVGARGYITKTEDAQNIFAAIREVVNGRVYISPKFSQILLQKFAGNNLFLEADALKELSDREFEVFQLIGRGLITAEISHHLCISPKTVESHRICLKKKLNLKSALELNIHALRWAASNQLI